MEDMRELQDITEVAALSYTKYPIVSVSPCFSLPVLLKRSLLTCS